MLNKNFEDDELRVRPRVTRAGVVKKCIRTPKIEVVESCPYWLSWLFDCCALLGSAAILATHARVASYGMELCRVNYTAPIHPPCGCSRRANVVMLH